MPPDESPARITAPYGPWQPAAPGELPRLLAELACPWWVAGGHAIDLAVGRVLRSHGDIDVMVLRRDQARVQAALADWEWWVADPPGVLRPWRRGEELAFGRHCVWCRPGADAAWRVQFLLEEAEGGRWRFRRDPAVGLALDRLGAVTGGVPHVVPEVQVLYKAKEPRPRDLVDVAAVLPLLDAGRRGWLRAALGRCHPGHPWLARLSG